MTGALSDEPKLLTSGGAFSLFVRVCVDALVTPLNLSEVYLGVKGSAKLFRFLRWPKALRGILCPYKKQSRSRNRFPLLRVPHHENRVAQRRSI